MSPFTIRPPESRVREYRAAGVWRDYGSIGYLRWRDETPQALTVSAFGPSDAPVEISYHVYARLVERFSGALSELGCGRAAWWRSSCRTGGMRWCCLRRWRGWVQVPILAANLVLGESRSWSHANEHLVGMLLAAEIKVGPEVSCRCVLTDGPTYKGQPMCIIPTMDGKELPPAPIVGLHIEGPVKLDLVEIPLTRV